MKIYNFDNKQQLAHEMAGTIAANLSFDIIKRGYASLVVSGGSTPKPFFDALAERNLDWRKIHITLADERWVASDDKDSNEKLVRESFPKAANIISLYNGKNTPQEGIADAEKALAKIMPFSVVILGMGEDGHMASLFPNHPSFQEGIIAAKGNVIAVDNSPKPPSQRITLTLPAILNCGRLCLHITGKAKLDLLKSAAVAKLPIGYVLEKNKDIEVFYCD